MKYGELIAFEPIESVKQLTAGGGSAQAAEDVRTYVISESMREVLTGVVFPQLRYDNPDFDHKGLLLVATYGTGKTHLMSTIAAVAEHGELAERLTDPVVAKQAENIAGKFKVVRIEIGAVRMGLRDILAHQLSRELAAIEVGYEFPPLDRVANNKDSLAEMMAAFEQRHPDHGLLVVVDELLDYLRSRRDAELILDLGFLRELGEFCQSSRFRIIAGVQEMLWDNPRFALAQDEIRRVRERYQQFRISRDDVSYVVKERLLRKGDAQKAKVREHLARFAPGFESLGAQLESFVDLFPVHPAYLRTFESLTIVEKRRILETLSAEMRRRLDRDVPDGDPGLVCFDEYRADLDADPANRVVPDVKQVLDQSRVLREKVQRGLRNPADKAPALRILDALAVNRLTTQDVHAPIGMTPDQLRDDLCLLPPDTPELDPAFIASTIESIIDEIRVAVSGQYLTVNDGNGQVYLDLKKDVDYEQQIDDRAATLDEDALDAAYYKALERVLEVNDDPYVSGYRIWQYELPWASHRVTRTGYLFLGAPDERSTAQPPRDFYLYFLQPYSPHPFADQRRPDEVLIRLTDPDEAFTTSLRRYAGAAQKAVESGTQHRAAFEQRRDVHLTEMVDWLRRHMATHMTVSHAGQDKPFGEWLAAAPGARRSVKDQADSIAAQLLDSHFETRYPGYPTFGKDITRDNLGYTVQQALQFIARRRETDLGRAGLQALQLVDINGSVTADGPYARHLLAEMAGAGGRAVNRSALLAERDPGVWTWGPWHLEPAWLTVVAASLVYLGRAEIGMPGGTIGAGQLDRLADLPLADLEQIGHVVPPAGLDLAMLRRCAELVGVTPGIVTDNLSNDAVVQLISGAETAHTTTADAKALIQENPRLWGEELFDDPVGRTGRLDGLIAAAGEIRNRRTAGQMRNLALTADQLAAAEAGKRELARTRDAKQVHDRLHPVTGYLAQAASILGDGDPHSGEADALRADMRALIRADSIDKTAAGGISTRAGQLQRRYRKLAVDCHDRDRLDAAGDQGKQDLVTGSTWSDIRLLSQVSIIPSGRFASLENKLAHVGTCKTFTPDRLNDSFTCPDCGYRPAPSSGPTARAIVADAAAEAARLRQEQAAAIADSLAEPELAAGIPFLPSAVRPQVEAFIAAKALDGPVTEAFVAAANQLLQRFEIVSVDRDGLWDGVIGDAASLTPDELAARFAAFIDQHITGSRDRDRIRIVPNDGGPR